MLCATHSPGQLLLCLGEARTVENQFLRVQRFFVLVPLSTPSPRSPQRRHTDSPARNSVCALLPLLMAEEAAAHIEPLLFIVEALCRRPAAENGPNVAASTARRSTCPWSAAQPLVSFLSYLKSEADETREAAEWYALARDGSSGGESESGESGGEEVQAAARHLASELGDCLFDTLMAIRIAERDYPGVTLAGVVHAATNKIKGRTPYMAEWKREGFADPFPLTEEEAMRHWKAAKRLEPEHVAPWQPAALAEGQQRRRRRFVALAGLATVVAVVAAAVKAGIGGP